MGISLYVDIEFQSLIINQPQCDAFNLNSHRYIHYTRINNNHTTTLYRRTTFKVESFEARLFNKRVGVELKCQCTAAVRRQCHGYWSALSFGSIYNNWSNFRLTGRGLWGKSTESLVNPLLTRTPFTRPQLLPWELKLLPSIKQTRYGPWPSTFGAHYSTRPLSTRIKARVGGCYYLKFISMFLKNIILLLLICAHTNGKPAAGNGLNMDELN